jgi:hypothetical protein
MKNSWGATPRLDTGIPRANVAIAELAEFTDTEEDPTP